MTAVKGLISIWDKQVVKIQPHFSKPQNHKNAPSYPIFYLILSEPEHIEMQLVPVAFHL